MSGSITFGEIPANWNVPGAYAEVVPIKSGSTLATFPVRALVIGPMLGATVPADAPQTITSGLQADALFGAGSALAQACRAFITAAPYVPLDAIGLAPANAATQAKSTYVISGTPTAAGTAAVYINGVRVTYLIDPATDVTTWHTALATAINAVSGQTGCTAVGSAAACTLTSLEAGAHTNDIDIRFSPYTSDRVAGVTVAVSDFSGGSGEPDITAALGAVSNIWYTDIVSCVNDAPNLVSIATEMKRRYNAMAKLDAHAYYGYRGSYGQALALSQTVNSQFMTCLPAAKPRWAPWVAAGALAGIAAQALNTDPARQLKTLELTGLAGMGPDASDLYQDAMRNVLLGSGMSTFRSAQDGTVTLERVVTNYQRDVNGLVDTAWQDIMVPKTMTRVRYDWNAYVEQTWPRSKLADDGTIAAEYASDVVTPSILKASWVARSGLYEQQGWLENTATLGKLASFVRDATNRNRVNSACPLQIIGNIMDEMTSLQFEV